MGIIRRLVFLLDILVLIVMALMITGWDEAQYPFVQGIVSSLIIFCVYGLVRWVLVGRFLIFRFKQPKLESSD